MIITKENLTNIYMVLDTIDKNSLCTGLEDIEELKEDLCRIGELARGAKALMEQNDD